MPAQCYSPVRGRAMRATKTDACGNPVLGADQQPIHVVSNGFVSVEFEPEVDEGEDIEQKNANGELMISLPGDPVIKWFTVSIQFCQVDPELFSLITGTPVVLDPSGTATGFRLQRTINQDSGIGLETWTGIASAASRCATGTNQRPRFGYFLAPLLTSGIVQGWTIENAAATFTVVAKAVSGSAWGVGPYNVYEDANGAPAKLQQPIGDQDLVHIDYTTLPPPAPGCGVATPAPGVLVAA